MPMKFILLLLFTTLLLLAKPNDFSLIIDKPLNDALLDVTQDYDRQISAVGFSRHHGSPSKTTSEVYTNAFDYLESVSENYGSQMHIVRVDDAADISLDKAAKLSQFNEAVALAKTPTNGYFVGGYTLDGSLLVHKLDRNGDSIFTKMFGTKNYDKMNNLLLLSDGGVLAVGSSVTSRSTHDPLFETGLGMSDIYLTRFSKDGDMLWSKKYGTEYDDRGIDAAEARDGSIIVLSTTNNGKNNDITMMRVGENGDKIWLKHFKSEDSQTPHKVIKLRDNNFLALLSQKNGVNKEQIRIIKFDLQKNILIDKVITTRYSSVLKDIKEYSNSSLIAVGNVRDTDNTDALVMLLDSELSLLAQEHYGDQNYDAFNAVEILHNFQAAAVGVHTNNNSQESNMWIVKLNRDITLAKKANKIGNFYAELRKIFKKEIDAKKLVITEDLSIQFTDSSLYFHVAEYILTPTQKSFLTTFSKKLIPFLNANKNAIETLEINGHTSSEWGGTHFSDGYLKNEKLSMNRSYATLSYVFSHQDKPTQTWLSKILSGNGLSYSKKRMVEEKEDKEKSRRVTFKIILRTAK